MLVRRRLFQLSVFDMLLAMTAATAMLVCYGALAPRALVYTAGFVGGLVGTALAMNRGQPRVFEALCLGAAFGMAGGYIGAFAIEALHRGIPFKSAWMWQLSKGRVPATEYAAVYGLIGGVVASVLSSSLRVVRARAAQQRDRAEAEDAK
jgi:hypothetical protein